MTEDPRRCPVCGIPLRPSRSAEETCGSPSCRRLIGLREPAASKVRRCIYCSRAAAPQDDVCDDARCRGLKSSVIDSRMREARRREAIDRMTRDHERDLRAVPGSALPDRLIHARLPANERTIAPLPAERREAFAVHLGAALDRAMDDPDRPFPESPETPPGQAPLIQAACAACRGSCCQHGGDRAFLYPDHLRRHLRDHPGKTRKEVLAEYQAHLPAETYHDSCVYHAATGCALPRDLRSNLCNTFLCGGLSAMLEAQSREAAPVPVLAFCIRDHGADLVRSTAFDAQGAPLLGR